MKPIRICVVVLLLSLTAQAQEITLAITNCHVITMRFEKVLKNQTILLSNETIIKVLPAAQWKNTRNIPTIDASGSFVMPALADMHIHVNQYSNWVFPLLLTHGVTTIRVMSGNEMVLQWRDSIARNQKTAPDIHTATQVIDGDPPYWKNLHDGPILQNPASAEQVINEQLAKGYEFIKVYNRLTPAVIKRIRQICFEKNIRLTGHIPIQLSKEEILTKQTGEIEHLSGYARYASLIDSISPAAIAQYSDPAYDLESSKAIAAVKIKTAARLTKKYQIWNCPTMVVTGVRTDSVLCNELADSKLAPLLTPVLGWWKSQGYSLNIDQLRLWDFKKVMLNELFHQKALLLAGTDSPAPWVVPGLSLHQELQYMVMAGLSNYEALRTATVNPASWFGKGYHKGTIEKGKRADLLILSANPLEDIRNTQKIVSVIFKGRVISHIQ